MKTAKARSFDRRMSRFQRKETPALTSTARLRDTGAMSTDLMTTREAAELLGVGTTSIKRWADDGTLECVRTAGGHRRFPRAAVLRFLHRDTEAGPIPDGLPAMSRGQIDALPLGVVQVDDDGTILLYNRTEAEFSGLMPADAEGRNFFTDVAACTNNQLVYGRFQEGIANHELDFTLDYTFTFRMRPTNVSLRLYRHKTTGTNWVLVDPE